MVQEITDKNFDSETKDGVVLTDFWATWCGPCRMQSPVIDKLEEENDDVKFTKMDVDANPATPQQFGIMAIPTLIIKKDGEVVEKLVGYQSKEQLEATLGKYTAQVD
ncbi:Thiol-disulfide isomerase and thioredoxin [Agrilactobacillus composti DSM 18527 = JCM 14202]|uniref:Thioredoxin n=1 Tax=Agrilactobacillus composti DSM 18527 = JCM 14202 TaxID=1423734 RepID=X0PRR9_9LACO|nr:thioredoxin [Agrilactobacillus composti]KRM32453.1 Thiol-disulfide isomerase and thioredoxin [Agrilactobacillus composti DSM 18527 = JCM 14202]GAF39876.1 thioredoxin [Agrilactobacillus composti DSM 18527 = JCM 14202]